MRARGVIGLLLCLGAVTSTVPAGAEGRPDGEAYIGDDDRPTVEVTDGETGGPRRPGTPGENPCVWTVVVADDLATKVYSESGTSRHSATGRWLQKTCDGIPVAVNGEFLIPDGGEVDVGALALRARASIGITPPTIRTSPEVGGRLYVRVPTWLWVDGGWWRPYEATASAGRVTATVMARPLGTTWGLGDGTTISCSGPGVAWRPGLPENGTDCSHTYTASSGADPDGAFDLTASVVFEVTWTSNVGQGGSLTSISRSSSRSVEVGEIQAIGTGS